MIQPKVNINGTSRQALIDQALAVVDTARALRTALADAAPHGRDYQTYPDNAAFADARGSHERYMALAGEIESIYQTLAESLT